MYIFYVLYSHTRDKFYIGHTGDTIESRIQKHNSNHKGFTGKVGDWCLYYSEVHDTKEAAYKREREVKAWKSRIKIQALTQ